MDRPINNRPVSSLPFSSSRETHHCCWCRVFPIFKQPDHRLVWILSQLLNSRMLLTASSAIYENQYVRTYLLGHTCGIRRSGITLLAKSSARGNKRLPSFLDFWLLLTHNFSDALQNPLSFCRRCDIVSYSPHGCSCVTRLIWNRFDDCLINRTYP